MVWDNLHDFNSPEDLPKSGDVILQPVEDHAHSVPEMVRTDFGELPHEYFRRLYPTERSAFLSDQRPDPKSELESVDSADLDIRSPSGGGELPQIPDPFVERVSREIVAEWLINNRPYGIDLDRSKVALNLIELVRSTSSLSTKNEPRCSATLSKSYPTHNRYTFTVICGEPSSDPEGHKVKFKFFKHGNSKKLWKSKVFVSCSCPFWQYYGCDWNAERRDYQEQSMSDGSAPSIRGRKHLICKHVAACVPRIRLFMLRQR